MCVNNTYRGVCALAGCHDFALLTFDVDNVLLVLFSQLAELEEGRGALAVVDGPCTFTEVRGLLGYLKCSDDSQVIQRV